ncbi:hypothetical protein GHYDROH2_23620 [Geobacter hydrogenophilus]|uniref:Uncharacterized protein n=1 Tax=Geobacter hydrogenophilus TaxID=40983 RepID=A0A9W6G1P6_9BACT|nr:hypothetical protein GHYDROH2_23620 [Geobacter hydrogenophilus]
MGFRPDMRFRLGAPSESACRQTVENKYKVGMGFMQPTWMTYDGSFMIWKLDLEDQFR